VRRPAPRPIAQALERYTAALEPASTLARVQARWEATVGRAIAACAHPHAEREGVLTVHCDAAVWAQELDLMAPELLGRLNVSLGEERLHKLRCRVA
jgi:predicted nucleic acid-binding Zn ribbon protein